MGLTLIAAPVVEPVSLAELKARLAIDHTFADALLLTLTAAARDAVERLSGRPMTTQTIRWSLDAVPPDGLLRLPVSPVQSIAAITVVDGDGNRTPWTGARGLDLAGEPARLRFIDPPPRPFLPLAGIEIDIVAGYGPTADAVPETLRQAVALLAAHWYVHRGAEPSPVLPPEVTAIAAGFRRPRLAA
jgi:uncharacterized phiE125 gp8 family phage protein